MDGVQADGWFKPPAPGLAARADLHDECYRSIRPALNGSLVISDSNRQNTSV
jgi:hypothetical protein